MHQRQDLKAGMVELVIFFLYMHLCAMSAAGAEPADLSLCLAMAAAPTPKTLGQLCCINYRPALSKHVLRSFETKQPG